MDQRAPARPTADELEEFLGIVEPKLRESLTATYGPVDGREATVDALSWAWEHWAELGDVDNVVGYLYRVGQTSTRRFRPRDLPLQPQQPGGTEVPEFEPALLPALARLSDRQRTIVMLVCAFGWPQVETAELLGISPPTVRTHLGRALDQLRSELEIADVG